MRGGNSISIPNQSVETTEARIFLHFLVSPPSHFFTKKASLCTGLGITSTEKPYSIRQKHSTQYKVQSRQVLESNFSAFSQKLPDLKLVISLRHFQSFCQFFVCVLSKNWGKISIFQSMGK